MIGCGRRQLPFGFTITQHEQNVSGTLGGMTRCYYSLLQIYIDKIP